MTPALTRRAALRAAGLAGAALATGAAPARAVRAGEGDSGLIGALKSAELVSIAAAERTLGGLGAAQRRTVRRLRAQDQEHAAALTTVLAGFGIEPEAALPPAPGPVLAAAGAVRRARRGRRRLAALLALEEAVAAAYRDALPDLLEPDVVRTAGSVLAGEAGHVVALRATLGRV